MTSGKTQAAVKIPVIKVHPQTAGQSPTAGYGVMISLQLLSCSAYDSDNFYFLLFLQSTHTHFLLIVSMLHYPPSTSQSCLYLKFKDLHNVANLVNQSFW